MRVSVHAAQRFLERVMKKSTYTSKDVGFTLRFLEKLLQDIVPTSYAKGLSFLVLRTIERFIEKIPSLQLFQKE